MGQSTAREVAFAIERGKPLRWWECGHDTRDWPVDPESYRRIKRAVERTCGNVTIGQVR